MGDSGAERDACAARYRRSGKRGVVYMSKRSIIAVVVAACLIAGVSFVALRSPSKHASRPGATAKGSASSSSTYVTGSPVKGTSSVAMSTSSFSQPTSSKSTTVKVHPEKEYNPPKTWTVPARSKRAAQKAASQDTSNSSVVAQSVGANFLGAEFLTDSNQVPPDSMGAAGPTQFLVAVNGRVRTFAKSTTTADGVMNTTLDDFFVAVGGASHGTSDPRVRYDRATGRWFITSIDTPPSGSNHVLMAVSDAGTITAQTTWHFFSIASDASTIDDFDTLGIDEDALYIGTNVFDTSGNFVNTTVYVVRKTSVLSSGPIVFTKFANLIDLDNTGEGPFAPMGVDNFDTNTNTGYIVGIDASFPSQLDLRRINNLGGTPPISSTIFINTLETNIPADVPQPGTSPKLDAGVLPNLSNAVVRNG